ncbi:IS3 family transposase [Nocardia gipuzkoensis]
MQVAWRLLEVSESGFYHWRSRPPSQRAIRHAWLTDQIRAVHAASRGTYGAPRMHAELTLGLGIGVGVGVGYNQVELLMARAGIKGLPGVKRARPRHQTPTAGDLVNRAFTRSQPNQLWVTDITEHYTTWIPVVVATVRTTKRSVKH